MKFSHNLEEVLSAKVPNWYKLTSKEKEFIISMYDTDNGKKTEEELSEEFGISVKRVKQIKFKAFRLCRRSIGINI